MGYLAALLGVAPYIRKGDDRLHLFVQTELFLIMGLAYILYTAADESYDPAADVLLSCMFNLSPSLQLVNLPLMSPVCLIALAMGVVVIFVLMALYNIRKIIRKKERQRNDAKHLKALDAYLAQDATATEGQEGPVHKPLA